MATADDKECQHYFHMPCRYEAERCRQGTDQWQPRCTSRSVPIESPYATSY